MSARDTRRIRRLKLPQPIEVEADGHCTPRRIRPGAAWNGVTAARGPWRIDQHWWRTDPVQRIYHRVLVEDGPPLTIYYDEVANAWFRQEY